MTEPILDRTTPHTDALHRYRLHRSVCYLLGLLLGLAAAWAEHRAWLPTIFSQMFRIHTVAPDLIGPCITQTCVIPMLFLIGLRRTAYVRASRFWCFLFWFMHGADLLVPIMYAPLGLLILLPILLWMAVLISRADAIAAAGPYSAVPLTKKGLPSYLGCALRLWGAALIAQFVFYLTIILITS